MSTFTDRAVYWMNEFKNNPAGDKTASRPVKPGVGSNWIPAHITDGTMFPTPVKYRQFLRSHHITDCITYVTDVMKYAYLDLGNVNMAAIVKQPVMLNDGVNLAKYLVEMQHWKAYYWNPDVGLSGDREYFDANPELSIGYFCNYNIRPYGPTPSSASEEKAVYEDQYKAKFLTLPKPEQDALFEKVKRYVNEHSYTADQAQKIHYYHGIKVTDSITGWLPTTRAKKPFANFMGHPNDRPEPPFPSNDVTTRAQKRLAAFGKVRFGFGIARAGRHTFLFNLGSVYEAHWDAPPADIANQDTDPLYQVRTLQNWYSQTGYQSGIILAPADAVLNLVLPAA